MGHLATRDVGAALALLACGAGLLACGAPDQEGAAASAAERFTAAAASDPAAACELLAPQTRKHLEDETERACRSVIAGQHLPTERHAVRTQVAGHSAQVVLPHQTVFLALFDSGWKVVAAGCRRSSSDTATPYECVLKGG